MSIFKGKTVVNRAEKIADFTIATAEYGSAVPEIIGTTRTSGNIIYYDDFTAHEHKETQRSGKGGGSKTVSITYTYTVAIIFALCEGTIKGLGKVWKNKDIYNYPSDEIGMTLYYGTNEQQPWPYVVGKHPEKALPYKGLAYMAGVIDLGSNASLPNFNFEVKGKLTEGGDGVDVNPADYILYILNKIGMGDVKISSIENYRRYCAAADLLISTPMDESKSRTAREIVNEIATITNAFMFWSNDQFKIVPLADRPVGDWKPNRTIVYDLTPDDFLPQSNGACVTYSRKDSSEIYNRFTVEFVNRANGYEKESVSYVDNDDLKEYGLRQASTTKALYIYTKKRAVFLAEELARKNKYERNQYTFKLDWAFCRLEVGDLVTLTDPSIGLNKQVALIDSVTEDAQGLLTFTAISRAGGDYDAAIYDVHDTDRPFVDFSPEPGDVDVPAIFQPPTELTSNGNELWIGTKGKSKNWGGCNVWVSDDNQHYSEVGKITNSARLGSLAAAVNASADEIEVTVNGTLLSGTEQDAERANTLCWLDGECLSYTTATMLQNGNYKLSDLIRGQYNTTAAAHAAGAKFVRCDETLLKSPLKKEDVGKKLWIKFTSYNIFGAREQSLADVEPYEYTILPYYIPAVLSLTAHNRYRELQDGISRYDIVVEWTPPDFANYLQGDVWYKTNNEQAERMVMAEGVPADEMGWQGGWLYGGSGKDQCVIPQAIVGDTYRLAVCTKDEYGMATSPDMSPQIDITVAVKTTTPNTPDDFNISFNDIALVTWKEVTNSDIAFYEIRRDNYPGVEDVNLLARTNGLSASLALSERTGTLYLYAKSAIGQYSAPADLKYYKAAPPRPEPPVLSPKVGGMGIKCKAVPSDCIGVRYYINDDSVYSKNNTLSYSCEAGVYDVTCAYVDMFGDGPPSGQSTCTVKTVIDESMIADEAISSAKLDKIVQNNISNATANANTALQNSNNALVNANAALSNSNITADKLKKDYSTTTQTETLIATRVANSLGNYSTTEQTATMISNSIANFKDDTLSKYSTTKQTEALISSQVASYTDGKLSSYSTIEQTNTAISNMVVKLNNATDKKLESYSTTEQTATMISNSIANFKDDTLSKYSTTKQTEALISSQVASYTDGKLSSYSTIEQTNTAISNMVVKLNNATDKKLESYSTITQTQDAISLAVKDIDLDGNTLVSKINLANGGILLDGKLIHITGQTLFDDNIVTKKMLQAGSVDASKINVESLSAITARIGVLKTADTGARMELRDNLILVYYASGKLAVRLGVW